MPAPTRPRGGCGPWRPTSSAAHGGAYGGSTALATGAVTLGWLSVLHAVVLAGSVLTLRLEARLGRPLAAATGPDLVRAA